MSVILIILFVILICLYLFVFVSSCVLVSVRPWSKPEGLEGQMSS